jgi:hypothetical protein
VSGWAGELMWRVTPATYFWVEPTKEVVAVYRAQAPSPICAYYRKMFKSLVYQALVETAYYVGALAAQ